MITVIFYHVQSSFEHALLDQWFILFGFDVGAWVVYCLEFSLV